MAQQRSPSPDSNGDDENAELFSAILSTVDMEQLPIIGSTILREQKLQATKTTPSVGKPIYGSYHVLFPLIFDDDLRWLVKIPINGTASNWDELSASSLASEAKTMRLLKRDTTIPLPDVLDFSSTTENTLRCPYIVMSFISGIPLYNVWFGHRLNGVNPDTTHARRNRALQGIASAMAQLDKFSFQSGGCPLFGSDGNLSGVGPMRQVDQQAMLDRWFIHQDPSDDPIYTEFPTSSDPKAYCTFMLDKHPEQDPIPKGIEMLLRQLIRWIPEPSGMDPFVLAHPDFDIQNFIVSEDGELRGIIDWDAMYGYVESVEDGVEPEGVWEDSPECLASYRGVYSTMIANHRRGTALDTKLDLCRISLITENLAIAAQDPRCRNPVLRKMLDEIWAAAGRDEEKPDLTSLAETFAEDKVESVVMDILKTGFNTLISKEGL
ncbi:uncharacterized protein F4822DRAFT_428829 [Hypoxylon trugodes]|uniref:uncharacterized protein n=1 Tax=Hypoxylon trugodes TaxID=326681 RepID=UPI0021A1DB19|nr:uncharacterized protein F4822DRAFT_428829 [Hypoxylon trugodes]KAI1388207.1 hypothetical protein F4822DRAFT_428829 [Hypoxylon trugodes]